MRRSALLPLPLVLVIAVVALGDDDLSGADKQLQGVWSVEKAERGGMAAKELVGATYEFKGGKMIMQPAAKDLPPRSATYRLVRPRAAGKPVRIVFVPQDGKNKGEDMEGILQFRDGKLEFCHCTVRRNEKSILPEDFSASRRSGFVYLLLKKQDK
jgi:uncharacterized protein (TIGR03067 family)